MKLGELRKRAQAAGVDVATIDAAIDEADDPKAAVAELIVSASASLEEQLAGMKLGGLRKRAKALGVDLAALEEVIDEADDPKAAVVQMILAASGSIPEGVPTGQKAEPHPEPEPEPEPEYEPVDSDHPFRSCLDRPYVQKEIGWARKYGKKIIIVFEKENHRPGFFDYGKAMDKYKATQFEFVLGIDAIPYQRDRYQAEAMLQNIFAKAAGAADIEPPASPKNQPGQWEFFLSHHQARGGDQVQTLSFRFDKKGKATWYDNDMLDKSESAMEEGVKHSKYFVLFLSAESAADAAAPAPAKPAAADGAEPQKPDPPASRRKLDRAAMVRTTGGPRGQVQGFTEPREPKPYNLCAHRPPHPRRQPSLRQVDRLEVVSCPSGEDGVQIAVSYRASDQVRALSVVNALTGLGYNVSHRLDHFNNPEGQFADLLRSIPVVLVLLTGTPELRPRCKLCGACDDRLPLALDRSMLQELRQALHMDKLIVPLHVGSFEDERTEKNVPAFQDEMLESDQVRNDTVTAQVVAQLREKRWFPLGSGHFWHFVDELKTVHKFLEENADELADKTSFAGDWPAV
eukprot:COSAG04_NODE_3158_length_3101_cov_38.182756_2_plen_572_part_00